jgi:hypothetical protein
MMFTDPAKVLAAISACDSVEYIRGKNRAKVNNLFNGAPLLSDEDAKKMGLRINCNLGEAPIIGQHGRRQYSEAFTAPVRYFKVNLPDAPPEKRVDWETTITAKLNKILKESLHYFELQRSQWASVLLHGIAPKIWWNDYCWYPSYVALEDFRVPTDTKCSLENLTWFAIRCNYTEGELAKKVFGQYAQKGWNKKEISAILDRYHEKTSEQADYSWTTQPEKMAELVKQNAGFYASDAVPTIPLWHFYFLDDSNRAKPKWVLRVVPDIKVQGPAPQDFLYNSDKPVASKLSQIVHIQFGDLNNKAPFLYHSVRALGFLMMEPIFHSNLLQCRFLQHVHEHMNIWLRSVDPAGKAKAQKIEMFDRAFIPEGVSIVAQTERHQVNPQLVEMGLDLTKNLKQEASISYTQDSEAARQGEETATGVMARVNSVNALVSGLLTTAFNYQVFEYREICRRFCIKGSRDEEVREFQKAVKAAQIPPQWIDSSLWEVEPEKPIGNGNPTMAQAMASKLLEMRPMYDGTAQQEILHEATTIFTGDPRKAQRWAPIGGRTGVNDAQEHAELAFSTLMLGVPVRQKEGLSLIDQIETILGLTAGVIARIEKTGNMATPADTIGLRTAEQYTTTMIQQLAQDKAESPRAKQYADALGKLMNTVKGFEQRLAEMNAQGEVPKMSINYKDAPPEIRRQMEIREGFKPATDPEAQMDPKTLKSVHGMAVKDAQAQHKAKLDEEKFHMEQRRQDTATLLEQSRKNVETSAEIEREKARQEAEPKEEPAANGAN